MSTRAQAVASLLVFFCVPSSKRFAVLGLLFAIPLVLSLITWKWLGGKEQDRR